MRACPRACRDRLDTNVLFIVIVIDFVLVLVATLPSPPA